MKVSAFTFLRNGTLLGYPYIESIRSLLPLVDEYVVNVGVGDDDTLERVRALAREDRRVRVVESVWNDGMSQRGFVYAQQKMIAQYNCTGDWAFYLEADEVVHEDDLPVIRAAMERHLHDPRVEALAFDYHHFYGTPQQVAVSPAWYRREARVIRNTIRTYAPDGLFWVVMDRHKRGRYPRAAMSGARIYHYGHVRSQAKMQEKANRVSQYWDHAPGEMHYGNIDPAILQPFTASHPAAIRQWLQEHAEHQFRSNPAYRLSRRERRHRWQMVVERMLSADFSKRHFVEVS